ncbi:MAG TPA: alpha/beta fold hydrolase [Solirubrobacteraceae bacterium]|jgi:pimeloyl-ACP methyl ester carboxylesterase
MSGAIADHYRAGQGPPLFLIHGYTATWPIWGPTLARLSEHYDVLAATLPGHTGGPPAPEGDDISELVDALERMLDEVGWDQAHIAGFSLGGWMTLELAKRGRARTATAFAPGGARTEHEASESRYIRTSFARQHVGARLIEPWLNELTRHPRFRREAMSDQMVDGRRVHPADAARIIRDFAHTPVFWRFWKRIGRGDHLDDAGRIDVPVSVVWGAKDRVLRQRAHQPFFERELPQATFTTLPRAGHVPFWDDPDGVVAAIRDRARD